jgi:small multidrug resistance pump
MPRGFSPGLFGCCVRGGPPTSDDAGPWPSQTDSASDRATRQDEQEQSRKDDGKEERMWGWLVFAIACEVTATLALRASEGFSRLIPVVVVIVGYALAFFALSQSMVRGMPVGQAYAVWAGLGVATVAVAGVVLFHERLTWFQVGGLALVVLGVLALRLGGSTTT